MTHQSVCVCLRVCVFARQVDPGNLPIQTLLNGEVMQDSNTSDMTFSVADIVSFLSKGMTLAPGTVILTGTPEVTLEAVCDVDVGSKRCLSGTT